MTTQLYNLFTSGKDFISGTVKMIAPYQPYIAATTIIGKAGWKYRSEQKLKNEVADLTVRIRRLQAIAKTPRDAEALERIREKITLLKAERRDKEHQIDVGRLTFGQIPSLFFSHPGCNPYQSLYHIYQRGFTLNRQVHRDETPLSTTIATVAAGAVSMVGTAASFLRLTGAVDADNQTANTLMTAALAVHLVEGTLAAASAAGSALARYRQNQIG